MNLWQMPNGEYKLTPPGRGHRPHLMATYIGSLGALAVKLREKGRERVAKRLPGLPEGIWVEVERLAAAQERAMQLLMPAVATATPLSDWGNDEE